MIRNLVIAALIVVAAALGYMAGGGSKAPAGRTPPRADPNDANVQSARDANPDVPVPVVAGLVERKDVPIFLAGIGTVNAFNSVAVKPREDGQLTDIRFREGQDVKVGDVLAVIDQRPYAAALKQAQASLAKDESLLSNAKLDLERDINLKEYAARQTVDTQKSLVAQYQAQLAADQAAIDAAKTNFDYTIITSPIDGRTGIRGIDIGNIVHATDTTAIVTVTQLQPISVVFTLPADLLGQVNRGSGAGPLKVLAYAKDNQALLAQGELVLVDNQIDATTGTVKLKATFANQDRALWPGQFVNARLWVDTAHGGVVVPATAVQRGPNGAYVWVIGDDARVAMRAVTVQQVQDGQALVAQGPQGRRERGGRRAVQAAAGQQGREDGARSRGGGRGTRLERPSGMNFSRPFILRPIATTLLIVGIVLLGALGYRVLPVAALPAVDFPTIQVTSILPGAGPDIMSSSVTTPLEHQFGQISGLAQMSSTSSMGTSQITLQFNLDRNIDAAAEDVQAAINTASSLLPLAEMPNPPTYSKVNPADVPIIILALTSDQLPLRAVDDYADTVIAQKLSQVTGVGLVSIEGGQKEAVRLQAKPAALAGMGLSLEDLRNAVVAATVNLPKGSLDGPRLAYQIGADDQLLSAAHYGDQIIAYRNGAPVRVKDVATTVEGVENDKLAGWYDGKPAVIIDIQRQPGANIIEVVKSIKALLPQLQDSVPPTVKLAILTDRTTTIRASIDDVQFTMLLTIALVVLVIFLFLRKLWATVIPSVTLPVSLIATFGVMHLAGFSLDNLSLMALTIAAGFVVDDAIVMIENIARYVEAGEEPVTAALKGARQIGFTVISLTVSLIAVFIPLLLMGGVVGRLFREFAITLSVAVVISALVSLTLTPMMCARLLKPEPPDHRPGRLFRWSEHLFEALLRQYEHGLRFVLRHQRATLAFTLATLAATGYLYVIVPKGFLPQQDTGLITGVTDAADDISFAAMATKQQAVAQIIRRDPAVVAVSSFVGTGTVNATGNTGRIYINLKPRAERAESADQVIRRLKRAVAGVEGIDLFMQSVQDIQIDNKISRTQYQYTLEDANPDELALWAPKLLAAMARQPELIDVASDQQSAGLQAALTIDRDAAARMGVGIQAIDDTLYDAFGQRQIATIYTQMNQYHVILEVDPAVKSDPSAFDQIYVRSSGATGMVPLSTFARFEPRTASLALNHVGLFPAVTLSFNVPQGTSLGGALQAIQRAEAEIGLPDTVATSFTGSAAEFRRSLANEGALILAAIVTVYIVLGVLYESYIHPVTILSTLPSAGVGALLALMLTGNDLSVISLIGIILLIGIVKKNAIMMIDFALDAERNQGLGPEDSIYQACLLRFRPIMMTTMAALLGAIPLAIGTGTGSELRRPLGIAIVGGLVVSQVLTLYTTPVIYLYFDRLSRRVRRLLGRAAPVAETSAAEPPGATLPDEAAWRAEVAE